MSKAEKYEKLALEYLGEDLYDICFYFYKDLLTRNNKYKILLTRRCFSLYKIFRVILKAHGIGNRQGTVIITDNAIPVYLSELRNALTRQGDDGTASVVIFDDIIIYGRTVNGILDQIFGSLGSDCYDRFRVKTIFNSSYSRIDKKYEKNVLSCNGAGSIEWKGYSCSFSKLIKAVDISNTTYVISYCADISDTVKRLCTEKLYFIKNDELKDLKVKPYALAVSEKNDVFCGLVRIYIYEELGSVLIAPLIILKDFDTGAMAEILKMVIDKYCGGAEQTKNLLKEGDPEVKMRLLSLLLSHVMLCDFARRYGLSLNDLSRYDYREILDCNFGIGVSNEFETLNKNISSVEVDCFSYCSEGIFDYTKIFEDFIFEKAMQDNEAALRDITQKRRGFTHMYGESLFLKKFAGNIMNTLDNGIAALKCRFCDGKYKSLVYSGEQVFRVISDDYTNILPALQYIDEASFLRNINNYELYDRFLQLDEIKTKFSDDRYKQLLKYIDILKDHNQQISDVMCDEADENDELVRLAVDFFKKVDVKNSEILSNNNTL